MIKKTIARTLVILALAAGAVGFAATPASAAWSDCPAQRFCVWKGFTGAGSGPNDMYYWLPQTVGTHTAIGGSWNDQISSVKNNTHLLVIMFQDGACSSFWQSGFRPGQYGNLGSIMDNSVSCLVWDHAQQS